MPDRPNLQYRFPRRGANFEIRDVALGNMSQFKIATYRLAPDTMFVGVIEHGAYTFSGYCNYSYVKTKLNIKHETDARAIADFINDQMGERHARQGIYSFPTLLAD